MKETFFCRDSVGSLLIATVNRKVILTRLRRALVSRSISMPRQTPPKRVLQRIGLSTVYLSGMPVLSMPYKDSEGVVRAVRFRQACKRASKKTAAFSGPVKAPSRCSMVCGDARPYRQRTRSF